MVIGASMCWGTMVWELVSTVGIRSDSHVCLSMSEAYASAQRHHCALSLHNHVLVTTRCCRVLAVVARGGEVPAVVLASPEVLSCRGGEGGRAYGGTLGMWQRVDRVRVGTRPRHAW